MKQIQVTAWCDGYVDAHPEAVPATVERTLTIEGDDLIYDLCAECDVMFQRLRERGAGMPTRKARQRASPVNRTRGEDLPRDCREPGCDYGEAPTRSALGQHVKQHHGKKLADYSWTT